MLCTKLPAAPTEWPTADKATDCGVVCKPDQSRVNRENSAGLGTRPWGHPVIIPSESCERYNCPSFTYLSQAEKSTNMILVFFFP